MLTSLCLSSLPALSRTTWPSSSAPYLHSPASFGPTCLILASSNRCDLDSAAPAGRVVRSPRPSISKWKLRKPNPGQMTPCSDKSSRSRTTSLRNRPFCNHRSVLRLAMRSLGTWARPGSKVVYTAVWGSRKWSTRPHICIIPRTGWFEGKELTGGSVGGEVRLMRAGSHKSQCGDVCQNQQWNVPSVVSRRGSRTRLITTQYLGTCTCLLEQSSCHGPMVIRYPESIC